MDFRGLVVVKLQNGWHIFLPLFMAFLHRQKFRLKLKISVFWHTLQWTRYNPNIRVYGVSWKSLPEGYLHAFYFISNTFISNTFITNARLKFSNLQNLSQKILRAELWNLCQMIAFFPNSILNTFLSGRPNREKKRVFAVAALRFWLFF